MGEQLEKEGSAAQQEPEVRGATSRARTVRVAAVLLVTRADGEVEAIVQQADCEPTPADEEDALQRRRLEELSEGS